MPNAINRAPVTPEIEHPTWCDPTQCTATRALAQGEAHRGTPVAVTVRSVHGTLEITAALSQAHCRWPTDTYVDFDVQGLRREHQTTGGVAAFTVEKLAAIGQLVMDLAAVSGSEVAVRKESSPHEQLGRSHRAGRASALVGGGRR